MPRRAIWLSGLSGNLHARSGVHFIHFVLTITWHWAIARYNACREARANKRPGPVGITKAEASRPVRSTSPGA